jgi:hypothetical protein
METEGSKQPSTGTYSEANKSSWDPPTLFPF